MSIPNFDRPGSAWSYRSMFKRHTAEKVYFHCSNTIGSQELKLMMSRADWMADYDMLRDGMVIELMTYMHGMSEEEISVHRMYPKDWWEALKERWFPGWLLDKWTPVKYERIDIEQIIYKAVCPHIADDPQATHLQWLAKSGE